MTAPLMREAADRLELALRKFWSVDVVPPRPPFCSGCSTDYPNHKPDCLITRLRMAADQMEGMVLVPLEPTEAMKKAAFGGVLYGGRTGPITKDFLRQAEAIMTYKAMIVAVRKTEQEG